MQIGCRIDSSRDDAEEDERVPSNGRLPHRLDHEQQVICVASKPSAHVE